MRSSYSSSRRSRRSSSTTTSSQSSNRSTHTYSTNATAQSDAGFVVQPWEKGYNAHKCDHLDLSAQEDCLFASANTDDDPRSSVETYASTAPSERDLDETPEYELPRERAYIYESDAIPTSASNFSKLFPTTRRILIQHDDSTSDGNMNLRLDTEAVSQSGEVLKMTLFHLRIKNLHERDFSLRRYCRDSGRQICSSKKKYAKPLPPSLQSLQDRRSSLYRSLSSALSITGIKSPKSPRSPRSHRSSWSPRSPRSPRSPVSPPSLTHDGSDDDDADDDDFELELQRFMLNSDVKATVPTNIIRLEFSNYAQVEIHRVRQDGIKKYDFEYWGESYSWKREIGYDSDNNNDNNNEAFYSYELINLKNDRCIAYISQDQLDSRQAWIEHVQGGWIPPSSLRIKETTVSQDLGDVIVATGLVALADDCIKRRWPSSHSPRINMPTKSGFDRSTDRR